MYIRKLTPETNEELAAEAVSVLKSGGVVLFPTDTLYCLGVDALSDAAVDAVYRIKGRDMGKPMHALVSSVEMAGRYGEIDDRAREILDSAPPGKVSLIVPQNQGIEKSGILRGIDTFGFRIPEHPFCETLLDAFGGPITATSANMAGGEPAQDLGSILAQLGSAVLLIDLTVDGGALPPSEPSTVVSVVGGEMRVLRAGAAKLG